MENIEGLSFIAFESILTTPEKIAPFENIMCSISGGSDSDVVLDLLSKSTDRFKDIHFVYFDTGMEYQATKDHLVELEEKYGITIERIRPEKPIPLACKDHGQPFLSKNVSEYISRLQKHGFQWEDDTYENLIKEYPNCSSALKWWTNSNYGMCNIDWNKGLKQFIIANPPAFKISNKCCHFTKKKIAKDFKRERAIDLSITGMRKAEGGIRAAAYKSCFSESSKKGPAEYRPIWWYKDEDKDTYKKVCDIHNSDCYEVYGMTRTGCAGCPLSKTFEDDLDIILKYEPKLYKASCKVFGDSYEYTRKYREFVKEMK